MHHHCLSCSADLGRNESVEAFPLGRRLAFDAWEGRLWVVCPKCRRWSLTPIEERWEPVEALEKLFRDSRLRVQAENIGVAKLPDGAMLVRIGRALPGELAAWRYGDELRRRRWKAILGVGSIVAVSAGVVLAGPLGLVATGVPVSFGNLALQAVNWTRIVRARRRTLYRLDAQASPTGEELVLRRLHADGAVLSHADDGAPLLWLPVALDRDRRTSVNRSLVPQPVTPEELLETPPLVLQGEGAGRVAGRMLVSYNEMGATRRRVAEALALLTAAGGADAYVREVARQNLALAVRRRGSMGRANTGYLAPRWQGRTLRVQLPEPLRLHASGQGQMLTRIGGIALEMALHEAKERRALEGELAQLEDEWREAELLARIADALPDAVPAGE